MTEPAAAPGLPGPDRGARHRRGRAGRAGRRPTRSGSWCSVPEAPTTGRRRLAQLASALVGRSGLRGSCSRACWPDAARAAGAGQRPRLGPADDHARGRGAAAAGPSRQSDGAAQPGRRTLLGEPAGRCRGSRRRRRRRRRRRAGAAGRGGSRRRPPRRRRGGARGGAARRGAHASSAVHVLLDGSGARPGGGAAAGRIALHLDAPISVGVNGRPRPAAPAAGGGDGAGVAQAGLDAAELSDGPTPGAPRCSCCPSRAAPCRTAPPIAPSTTVMRVRPAASDEDEDLQQALARIPALR